MSDSDKLAHDIHCLSNEIKDLIPNLITRIEYNKIICQSNSLVPVDQVDKEKTKTITFLKELKLFVNTR
jgi:hypothetical protein